MWFGFHNFFVNRNVERRDLSFFFFGVNLDSNLSLDSDLRTRREPMTNIIQLLSTVPVVLYSNISTRAWFSFWLAFFFLLKKRSPVAFMARAILHCDALLSQTVTLLQQPSLSYRNLITIFIEPILVSQFSSIFPASRTAWMLVHCSSAQMFKPQEYGQNSSLHLP